jgi:hypothetical protein
MNIKKVGGTAFRIGPIVIVGFKEWHRRTWEY